MTGLEERLRRVPGVSDLTVELGERGLTGIRVRIDKGSDEREVLEEIRRILVAYGLPSRRSSLRVGPVHEITSVSGGDVMDVSDLPQPPSSLPQVRVEPSDAGLQVTLEMGDRRVVAEGEATPSGAVEAMARAIAEWRGEPAPERVGVRKPRMNDDEVVLVVIHRAEEVGSGAAVVTGSLEEALRRAVDSAFDTLHPVG